MSIRMQVIVIEVLMVYFVSCWNHGNHSTPVNSLAATVPTCPGLPPVAELIPEVKAHYAEMPN